MPPKIRKRATNAIPPRRTRSGLSREQLVVTALTLLQDIGLDGLSTRSLAERLGVQSPALYWHIRNKNELLGLVADAICAKITLPSSTRSFRERLEAIATEYRRVLIAHRDAPRLFAEHAPTGPHRMQLYDAAVGAFLDGGFPAPEAVAMATFYRHFLLGMVTEEARQLWPRDVDAPRAAAALGIELSQLGDTARQYPNLQGAVQLLASIEPQALFRMGLSTLLDGMECRMAKLSARGS